MSIIVSNGGSTTESNVRLQITLDAALLSGDVIEVLRSGQVLAGLPTQNSSLSYQYVDAPGVGSHSYAVRITRGASATVSGAYRITVAAVPPPPSSGLPSLGLALHLDASVASSLTLDAQGKVIGWADLIFEKFFSTSPGESSSFKPIVVASDPVFALPCINFSATYAGYKGPSLKLGFPLYIPADVSVFVIGRGQYISSSYTNIPFYLGNEGNPFAGGTDLYATQGQYLDPLQSSCYRFRQRASSGVLVAQSPSSPINYFNYNFVASASVREHRLNGAVIPSNTTGSWAGMDLSYIMPSGTDALNNGILGEIIVYDRVLSAAEILQVEAYLQAKWIV